MGLSCKVPAPEQMNATTSIHGDQSEQGHDLLDGEVQLKGSTQVYISTTLEILGDGSRTSQIYFLA